MGLADEYEKIRDKQMERMQYDRSSYNHHYDPKEEKHRREEEIRYRIEEEKRCEEEEKRHREEAKRKENKPFIIWLVIFAIVFLILTIAGFAAEMTGIGVISLISLLLDVVYIIYMVITIEKDFGETMYAILACGLPLLAIILIIFMIYIACN